MSDILEWFQCNGCGRRYRWRADIAGTKVRCACGGMVLCPEVDVFGGERNPSDTLIETVDSVSAASPRGTAFDGPVAGGDGEITASRVRIRHKGDGPFGLTTGGQLILWTVVLLLAISMVIHAAITHFPWYIGISLVLAPIALWKFTRIRRRWQRGRKLTVALRELFEEMS